jgi:hypothetical protein
VLPSRLVLFAWGWCVLLPAVALARVQSAEPDPVRSAPAAAPSASQADEDDDTVLRPEEPNFRLINLPTTLRLPQHASSFDLTHRFNANLRVGTFSENASNLFGLDNGATVGFEYRFAPVRRLQTAVYRVALDKTFQFYAKYDGWRQRGRLPVSLSLVASVEGADNFQERRSPALGAVIARSFGGYGAVYASPVWVHNTAALLGEDRDTFFVGLGGRYRVLSTVYVVGEVAPRVRGYDPGTAAFGFGVEKRVGLHVFQLNFNNTQGSTFGQIARGGFPNSLYAGFNLNRKFF